MSPHARAMLLGTAVGAVALFVAQLRPLKRHASALPSSYRDVVQRHAGPESARELESAVRDHIAAGNPLTRAALGMLASIYLSPAQVNAVTTELKQRGMLP